MNPYEEWRVILMGVTLQSIAGFATFSRACMKLGLVLGLPGVIVGTFLGAWVGDGPALLITVVVQAYSLFYVYFFLQSGRLNPLMKKLWPWGGKKWDREWWSIDRTAIAKRFAGWPRWFIPRLRGLQPTKYAPVESTTD